VLADAIVLPDHPGKRAVLANVSGPNDEIVPFTEHHDRVEVVQPMGHQLGDPFEQLVRIKNCAERAPQIAEQAQPVLLAEGRGPRMWVNVLAMVRRRRGCRTHDVRTLGRAGP
jgi:hypothetical protein